MAEATGLAVGLLSLLSSCVQGYGALRTIRNQSSEAATIACCLEIEEKRLVLWSRNAGLFDDTCLIPTSEIDTVMNTLRQVEVITQDASTLTNRYGLRADAPAVEESESRTTTRYITGGPELSSRQLFWGKRRVTAAKLAMRWLFDRDQFEKIVHDLRTLNNGLNALLHEGQQANFHRDFAMMSLRSTSTDNVNTLQIIREAAKDAYVGLARSSDQRFHALILHGSSAPDLSAVRRFDVSSLVIPPSPQLKQRDTGFLERKPVLIEWRSHKRELLETVSFLESRTKRLAGLLGRTPKPPSFRVLDCIGYCHDQVNERFGLVFSMPPEFSNTTPEIVSLYDFLQSRAQSETPLPTLHDRFRLASSLANSILQLHAARWLHRDLRSSNIIFFRQSAVSQADSHNHNVKSFFEDYFIVGFGYSREDAPGALSLPLSTTASDAAYQHPDLVASPRQGYRVAFDAYSLGIVLLEVGFWRPVDVFRKLHYTEAENLDRLVRHQLRGDLAHRMGTAYQEATRKLLTEEAYGEEDGADEGERLVRFFRAIVLPLATPHE